MEKDHSSTIRSLKDVGASADPDLPFRSSIHEAGEARCRSDQARAYEKMYGRPALGVVLAGSFEYRSQTGGEIVSPGALLFGNTGERFTCRHVDDRGNRRAVLYLAPELLEEIAADQGIDDPRFTTAALPPTRELTRIYGGVRRAAAGHADEQEVVGLTAAALSVGRRTRSRTPTRGERRRVADVLQELDGRYADPWTLSAMAASADLSRFHFIRVFRAVSGETPRQWLIGRRLRAAADGLLDTGESITSIALTVGFDDLSTFNTAFRSTFGMCPRVWRRSF